ncbi:hypothetical protein K435DRAFT_694087 [Dendrothele bispora CBS 962.96]|uniref:DUF6589 domain-containing protein n=1 Tax=Dendrothele bispora (strain CBS 962.96) TaxID=1314807 RepID=A0A4S8KYQ5_DENBC|nr:hypothetical protein K435DRAFT_694087 [Dendrothele bispora CBS 962.96]
MPKDPRKPRKTTKNWLTAADSAPDIHPVPPNASNYRLHPYSPSTERRTQTSGSSYLLLLPISPLDNVTHSKDAPIPDTPSTLINESLGDLAVLGSPFSFSAQSRSTLFKDIQDVPPPPSIHHYKARRKRLSPEEHLQSQLACLDEHLQRICADFGTIGDFLSYLFWSRPRKRDKDLRLNFHQSSITRFLQGHNNIKPIDIVKRIFHHRNSFPTYRARQHRKQSFSLDVDPTSILYARVAISAWAAQLCAARAHRDIATLTKSDPDHPEDAPARMSSATVTWKDINTFSPERSVNTFRRCTPFLYSFFEYLTLPRRYGIAVERKNRPVHTVRSFRIEGLNPLITGHNRLANGYLSLPYGIHQFGTQTHVDEKRLTSVMGLTTCDLMARKSLKLMTDASLEQMRKSTVEETARGEVKKCYVLDNVQRQDNVYEGGLLRVKRMKCGTAATMINMEDVEPGAFDLSDHLQRVVKNLHSTMTLDSLFERINWSHHHESLKLYIVKTLAEEVPELQHLLEKIFDRFRTAPIAIHRIPASRQTQIQPLGTNSERELESQGMKRCIADFDSQIGFEGEDLLEWVGGDGASFATILRLQKYLAPTAFNNRDTLRNKIAIWHAKDTALKAIAQNHFGPSTSADPSSISKLYTVAGLKRPANLKHCDHYPTMDGLTLIWIAQVLDCWRIYFGVDDLSTHFHNLGATNSVPTLDVLLSQADVIIQQYISLGGYERVLSIQSQRELKNPNLRIKTGSEWVPHSVATPSAEQMSDDAIVKESEIFDGDRSLANSILFKVEFSSFLLLEFAIKDGDMGRVLEQLRIWIFLFSGSSHQQYASYLLELHCLLEFESSPALRQTILNNYLVKFGLPFKERDLMQEDHNGKIQIMVPKAGGEFDGPYYRNTITPNVHNLININRNFEIGFNLAHRKTSHTSPGMRPEVQALLSSIHASELHLFRSQRSYLGHIAIDLFTHGYERLGTGGKLAEFKRKTASRSKFIQAIENEKQRLQSTEVQDVVMADQTSNIDLTFTDNSSDGSDSETTSSSISEDESDSDIEVRVLDLQLDDRGSQGSDCDQFDEDAVMEVQPSDNDDNWSD